MPDGAPPLIDFSPLGNLVNDYRQAQQYAEQQRMIEARRAALAPLANSTDAASLDTASRQLLASGDLQGGISLSAIAQKYGDRQAALELSKNFSNMFGAQPTSQPAPQPQAPTNGNVPRGIRNNNPLNIEAGNFTQSQPGFAGSDGRFAKFETPQAGIQAASNLLDSYASKGLNTVSGIIGRWAPQGENDSRGYAASVAGRMGVDPNQPLNMADPQVKQSLIMAMAQFENGRPLPPSGSAVAPAAAPASPAQAAPQASQNQAPQAMFAGRPMDQWVRGMSAIATNPNAPKEIQQFATEFVKGAIAESGLTQKQKDYRGYVQQEQAAGRPVLSMNEWDQQGKQSEGEKTLDKGFADTYLDIQKQARDSRATTGTLETLGKLTTDPRFYSGTGGGYVTQAKRLLSSMGVAAPDSAQPNELFEKLANKLVLDTSGGSLGTGFSNADRDFMQRTVANINNTPEGNRAILQLAMAVEQRKQQIAQLARDYVKTRGGKVDAGLDQTLSDYAEKNPLFGGPKSGTYSGAGDWQDASPPIANAIGAQPQPSAPVGGIQEGMTATNAKTGQKIIFRAGQWQPVPTGPAT